MLENSDDGLQAVSAQLDAIAFALGRLANMAALQAIAEHGSPADRERALEILKEGFTEFKKT